jgi:protein-disulfide isomerase
LKINRRDFVIGALALTGGAATAGFPFGLMTQPAFAQTASQAELLQPSALPEMVQGSDKAPVTIIEYASMTCGHCATFHKDTYPTLKSKYIDTGKVRFIFREFPLDPLAAAGFMLARCADKGKYFPLIDTLFNQQKEWVVRQPLPPLLAIAKQAGFSQEAFEQCLANQKLLDQLEEVRQRAAEKFGVNSTPTFFINGKMVRGVMTPEELDKQVEPYLKAG